MKNIIMALVSLVLFCTGCRTYVGSDDIFETATPEIIKVEHGGGLRRGVVLEIWNGKCVLTFAERSMTRQTEKIKKYICGRKYYYLDKKWLYADFLTAVDEPIAIFWLTILVGPFQCFHDCFYSWGFNWKLRGEYAPGIGYCIAYLPIVHMLCTSFLRPPYAYKRAGYCEEEDRTSPRLVRITTRDHLIPVFAPDPTCGEILISHGNQTISRKLSPNGKVEFGHRDFPDVAFNGDPLEYTIVHRKWGQRWILRSSPLVSSTAVRDWNIFADEKCDFPTRGRALIRLEHDLGEKSCHMFMNKLLAGDLKIKPIYQLEIAIFDDSAALVEKTAVLRPGVGEYKIGLGYEKTNRGLAVSWFRKAAEQGNPDAQFKLGECYFAGTSVTKDLTEAAAWWRKAAGQGHREAQFKLGECYENGYGVNKDTAKAVKWYLNAAEKGYFTALLKLECSFVEKSVTDEVTRQRIQKIRGLRKTSGNPRYNR